MCVCVLPLLHKLLLSHIHLDNIEHHSFVDFIPLAVKVVLCNVAEPKFAQLRSTRSGNPQASDTVLGRAKLCWKSAKLSCEQKHVQAVYFAWLQASVDVCFVTRAHFCNRQNKLLYSLCLLAQ